MTADGSRILDANREACDLLGYSEADLRALSPGRLLSSPAAPERWRASSGAVVLRRRGGEEVPCRVSAGRVGAGGEQRLVVVLDAAAPSGQGNRLEAMLRAAIDQLSEALIIYDTDDRLLFFNRAYRKLFPYMPPFEALEGKHFFEVIRHSMVVPSIVLDPLCKEDPEAYLERRLQRLHHPANAPFEQETGGQWHLVHEQRVPGVGFLSLRRDITDEKRLRDEIEERETLFRTLVETAPFGLVLTRMSDHRIVAANRRAAQMFAVPYDEAEGAFAPDYYVNPADRERLLDAIRRDGAFRDVEVELKDAQGRRFWSLVSGRPSSFRGEPVLLVGVVDISARRQSEALVARTNQRLADLAARLELARAEADAARLRAEEASRSKSEFLAMMSHELRTPLNAIIGFSEVLARELMGPLGDAKYAEYATIINESGSHLLAIINDILDLAKVEAGKMEILPERLDPQQVARECTTLVRNLATEREIDLGVKIVGAGRGLYADPRAIKQVLVNLLSNACKFTGRGGRVTLRITAGADGGCAVIVEDNGIGMSESEIAKALELFGQVGEITTSGRRGTGLGLPLVKRLVELHRGGLDIHSRPHHGTRVVLRFPPPPPASGAA